MLKALFLIAFMAYATANNTTDSKYEIHNYS